jgi:hypothetical protein
MTVRLELKPELEAALNDLAKAQGLPLDAYLQRLIEGLARTQHALDRLAEMGRGLPRVLSSAFSRESIYEDRN